jgi:hypothetical protein
MKAAVMFPEKATEPTVQCFYFNNMNDKYPKVIEEHNDANI